MCHSGKRKPSDIFKNLCIFAEDFTLIYEKHPKFLHHSPHRPRQIDTRRPSAGEDQHAQPARNAVAGARRHGPRTRKGNHHQEPRHPDGVHGPRRTAVHAQPDRHPGTRRLLVRSVARNRLVRRGAAGGRRHAGHSGADDFEPLPRRGARPGDHPRAEQDRHGFGDDRRGEGSGDRPHRMQGGGYSAGIGQDGTGRRRGVGSDRKPHSRSHGRRGRAVAGADLRLGVQPLPRDHRLFPRLQRHAAQGRPREVLQHGQRVRRRRNRRAETQDAAPAGDQGRGRGVYLLGDQDLVGREGRRHDHLGDQPRQRGHRRIRGREADGLRGRLPGGGRPVRGPARVARKIAAQRRFAHVRAGKLAGARIRVPLRIPRAAAHGDHSGAAVPRIRHGRHHDRAQRVVPHHHDAGRRGRGAQPLGTARGDKDRQDRGTLHPRADHHQVGVSGQRHQTLHRQARGDEEPDIHHAGPRGGQLRHAPLGDRLRLLRQAQEHLERIRLVRLPPHGIPALETRQARHPAQRGAGRRPLVAHLHGPRLRFRTQDVRKAQGADPPPAVRHRHTGRRRRQDHRTRNGQGRAQGRDGEVLRRRYFA